MVTPIQYSHHPSEVGIIFSSSHPKETELQRVQVTCQFHIIVTDRVKPSTQGCLIANSLPILVPHIKTKEEQSSVNGVQFARIKSFILSKPMRETLNLLTCFAVIRICWIVFNSPYQCCILWLAHIQHAEVW